MNEDKVRELRIALAEVVNYATCYLSNPGGLSISDYNEEKLKAICALFEQEEKCPACNGSGHNFLSDERGREETDEPCPTCHGTGKVAKQRAVLRDNTHGLPTISELVAAYEKDNPSDDHEVGCQGIALYMMEKQPVVKLRKLNKLPAKIFKSKKDTIDTKMNYIAGWNDAKDAIRSDNPHVKFEE